MRKQQIAAQVFNGSNDDVEDADELTEDTDDEEEADDWDDTDYEIDDEDDYDLEEDDEWLEGEAVEHDGG